MRIQRIKIERWRHFTGVDFSLPDSAPIICIVGGNGTGKSQLLELIAACAQRLGLAAGFENSRGDPFNEDALFQVDVFAPPNTIPQLDTADSFPEWIRSLHVHWDRTLRIGKGKDGVVYICAGGLPEAQASAFAHHAVGLIQRSASVHYLSLDADRAYPKIQIGGHQLGEIFDRDWEKTKKQSSFRITRNLYEEWFRFLIGRENQESNKHIQAIRLARDAGAPEPLFVDQFESYKAALRSVLPHLLFLGVDPQTRQIRYNSTGTELSFDQLSGGEREIAFLIGQIERFALKRGLLLVDEPELHLNYDLLRSWIGFLKASVENGQIWLATHALEVVEVTGQDATIILHRDEKTRQVLGANSLNQQPVVATLSRAIGSPAFSIESLAFVIIEGEEKVGERERFRLLCDVPRHVRFLEGGACNEVNRRIENLRDLALASGQAIRIGGVVDQDWRSAGEQDELRNKGLHVLGVHEVENFFIHPPTLRNFLETNGGDAEIANVALLYEADRRAGTWVFDAARTDRRFRQFPEPSKAVRELVHGLSWEAFTNDIEPCCKRIAEAHGGLEDEQQSEFKRTLVVHARIYERKRLTDALWRVCEGKEIFRSMLTKIGVADEDAGERAITAVWSRRPDLVPEELRALRDYIQSL